MGIHYAKQSGKTVAPMSNPQGQRHESRHPRHVLTDHAVDAAEPWARPRRIADGGGLYLLVSPSGAKSWILRVVIKGQRCDLGLGGTTYIDLVDARANARRLRRIARTGGDPRTVQRWEHV